MQRKINPFERKGEVSIHPPPSFSAPSSSDTKISPAILLVIVILSIAFFICGILHLLVRFLIKRPSIYSLSLSRRYSENSVSGSLQRQLQQLFRLHDSGLDQHIIDSLPVFCYKKIVGLKEPFDCAICLCEFSDQDKLRLLPVCSHAFHVDCIDTWLLSNSTCPLCRNTLLGLELGYSRELSNSQSNDGGSNSVHSIMEEESCGENRIYSVRLGKYRSSDLRNNEEDISSRNLDARRCYSMGSCEYVIGNSDLLVELSDRLEDNGGIDMRINNTSKGESFSVSKIWQWSKKGHSGRFHLGLSLNNKVQAVEDGV